MTAAAPSRFAVIGNPIAHSRSPRIHAMFAEQTGIALTYETLLAPLDGFVASVQGFFAEGGRGLNVTVPFKLEAFELAGQGLSERARAAGAVNTLWQQEGVVHGCNTDGVGLVQDLRRLAVPLDGARVLLVGAGGAARGVLGPLLEAGCAAIHVVNRTESRAHELLAQWLQSADAARVDTDASPGQPAGVETGSAVSAADAANRLSAGSLDSAAIDGGWDVVINATASSLGDAAPALPGGLYAPNALAYDMMYGAQATPFMKQAEQDGAARTADGLGMLVGQAAESFRIWHDVLPQVEPVLEALRADLARVSPP